MINFVTGDSGIGERDYQTHRVVSKNSSEQNISLKAFDTVLEILTSCDGSKQ